MGGRWLTLGPMPGARSPPPCRPAAQAPPARGGVRRTDGRTEGSGRGSALPAGPAGLCPAPAALRPLPRPWRSRAGRSGNCRGSERASTASWGWRRAARPRRSSGRTGTAGAGRAVLFRSAPYRYGGRGAAVALGSGPCRTAPCPRVPPGSWRCATTPIRTRTTRRRPNASRRSTALTPRSATPTGDGCTISTDRWASTWPSSSETMPSVTTSSCPSGGSRWAPRSWAWGSHGGPGGLTVTLGSRGRWTPGSQSGHGHLKVAPGVSRQP